MSPGAGFSSQWAMLTQSALISGTSPLECTAERLHLKQEVNEYTFTMVQEKTLSQRNQVRTFSSPSLECMFKSAINTPAV